MADTSLPEGSRSDRLEGDSPLTAFTVDDCWLGEWLGATTIVFDETGFRLGTGSDPAPVGHLKGTAMPGFRDSHVHLGLVDGTQLRGGGIAAVDDFGWDLATAREWPHQSDLPQVTFAGQLLTAAGGYPTESEWAPREIAYEVAGPQDVKAAVDTQLDAGAGFIKVALNSDVGPVFDTDTLAALVEYAHSRGVTVAAHTQGVGQAERALTAGVDRLAHTPWSERLSDALIDAMATAMSWVSTLDIHGWGEFSADFTVANENLRRFHAAGGDIRYGTDLGNGPLPLGINYRELLALEHAGLNLDALLTAIARPPARGRFGEYLSFTASEERNSPAEWLAGARLIGPQNVGPQNVGPQNIEAHLN